MNRPVHILLAVLVFACPLWCAFATCSDSPVVTEAAPTCCCQVPAPAEDKDDSPSTPEPTKNSQCICGGAVLVDIVQLEQADVWTTLFAVSEFRCEQLSFPTVSLFAGNNATWRSSARPLRQLNSVWTL